MAHPADMLLSPAFGGRGNLVTLFALVNIGATGAPTVNAGSDPGFTFTRDSAGVYTVVVPVGARGIFVPVILKSTTVFQAVGTAITATGGTIRFNNGTGTATDPANGDVIGLIVLGTRSAH